MVDSHYFPVEVIYTAAIPSAHVVVLRKTGLTGLVKPVIKDSTVLLQCPILTLQNQLVRITDYELNLPLYPKGTSSLS